MGALTDTRKRCYVDLFSPLLPSPKKLRTSTSSLLIPSRPPPPRFPPAAPLRRPVQGPQRTIKVFGLGGLPSIDWASDSAPKAMGGSMGKPSLPAATAAAASVDAEDRPGLRLDEYRRLVEELQEDRKPIAAAAATAGASSSHTVDVEEESDGRAEDEMRTEDVRSLDRNLSEKPVVAVALLSTPVPLDSGRSRRSPLYKELLEESSRKHDGRLSSLDFEIRLVEKKVSAFRITSHEKPKEEEAVHFAPLTEEDENDVGLAFQISRKSQLHDVLVMHEQSNIEITREIIQCLRSGAWLNDEVINLYFELLKEREKRNPGNFLKCHFFNTFFYKKLTGGQESYDFKAVRRWTTQRKIGYGLIECDKIFVPIHKEIHWCLAVINIKEEKFQYLDSLGHMDRGVLNILARYLVDEVKDKSGRVIDVKSWKKEFVENLPLQKNGWDCGMFMVKYADFFSRGLALTFNQEHMEYFRKRTAKEILRLKAD